jgi:hypothetical protein
MSQTKLTLRLDSRLIDRAKRIARLQGKSVSRMVGDYFRTLDSGERPDEELPPLTRSLYGILAGSGLGEKDYRDHLEKKHE